MCDDLNDYQGVFGGHPQAKTPNIDKLASSGIRFTNAQTNVPVCQPSRNSLFTGVYPHNSKDFKWTPKEKQNTLKITGSDKQQVGAVVSKLKTLRKIEPYKGKGIREKGQYVLKKEGKKI